MKLKFIKVFSLILTIILLLSVCVGPSVTVSAAKTNEYSDFIKYRGQDLKNTYAKLSKGEKVNVVYFGGSVTNGHGASNSEKTSWRALVGNWLSTAFPNAEVNNINAAYGGTGSYFGAYRVKEEVISHSPDLVFIEFAINDHYDNQIRTLTKETSAMQFETIVRSIRSALPDCDIVTVLTTEKCYINANRTGELHTHAQAHEDISIAYNIPSLHIGRALVSKLSASDLNSDWSNYFTDIVHPNDAGYAVYFDVFEEYLANCLQNGGYDGKVTNHKLPSLVNEYLLDGNLSYIDANSSLLTQSNQLGGKNFKNNDGINLLRSFLGGVEATAGNNSVFALKFTGTELALLQYSSEIDNFLVTVDGKRVAAKCYGIYPEVLVSGLSYGEHTVTIKPVYKNNGSSGTFYIMGFFTRNENNRTAKYDHAEHVFKTYVSNNDASCKKDGTKTAKCSVSGCDKTDTVTDTGTKLPHKYKINVIKAATNTADGEGERVCSMCGRFDGKVVIPKGKTAEDVLKSESDKTDSKQEETQSTVESEVTTGEVGSSNKDKSDKVQKKGIPTVLIVVLVVVLVLLFAGIGVLVFILIKRKKEAQ